MLKKRTDLALEAHEIYTKDKGTEKIDGIKTETFHRCNVCVTRVKIETKEASEALNKPVGTYVTIEIPNFLHQTRENFDSVKKILSEELQKMMPPKKQNGTILAVGLGNRHITADSLGPKTVDGLLITRHLFELMPDEIEKGVSPVCALSPGVLGITGIETGEIVKGVAERINPDVIIAIDALASRNINRVMTTIQLADTGITPGAGIGNSRRGINFQNLNIPVIAIGVPTVVDAATMANDTIDMVIETMMRHTDKNGKFYETLKNIAKSEKYALIDEILNKSFTNLVVTPKDVDEITDDLAEIISDGINISVHSCIDSENVSRYSR